MNLPYVEFENNNGQLVPIITAGYVDEYDELFEELYQQKINELSQVEDDGDEARECFNNAFYDCKNAILTFDGVYEMSLKNEGGECVAEHGKGDGPFISCRYRQEIVEELQDFNDILLPMNLNLMELIQESSFYNSSGEVKAFLSELREEGQLPFDLKSSERDFSGLYLPEGEIFCDVVWRDELSS